MVWRVISSIFILSLVSHFLRANPVDSVRERHIKRFKGYFFIYPVIKQRSTSFDIQNLPSQSQKLSYKPNGNYGFGFGGYMFGIGFEFTLSIQPDANSHHIYGRSSVNDLQSNILGKHWGLDLFTQNYNGFYRSSNNVSVPPNTPYPQRPDISTWNTGVNGIYIFNKDKYSIRAAYNFSERQIRSGGSFLLTGTINTFSLRADSAIYGPHYESVFGAKADFSKLDYTTISVAPGYAHTFVFKSLFFNGSLSIGPANHWVYYQSAAGSTHEITLNSFVDLRLAIGYNSDRFFSGVTFITQARNIKFEQVQFTNSNSSFKMVLGYRFREVGILKKRAKDFIPFLKKKEI